MRLNTGYSAYEVLLIPYISTLYLPNHFHLPLNSIGINSIPILVNSIGYSYISYEFNRYAKT